MKRFALLATTCACVLWIGALAHSQTGAGGTGSGGASSGTGSGGVQAGTGSGGIGAQPGATGVGVPGQTTGGIGQPGQPAQPGQQGAPVFPPNTFGGPNQTPWFSDPAVRQQLRMNDAQFNLLNSRYRDTWNRYNRNRRGINDRGLDNPAGIRPHGGQGQQNAQQNGQNLRQNAQQSRQDLRQNAQQNRQNLRQSAQQNQQNMRQNAQLDQRNALNQGQAIANGQQNALTQQQLAGQQQQVAGLRQFQQNFDNDFSRVVDSTFTDPAARERYNQLYLQYQGVGAFSNPMVAERLNLNPEQQAQFGRVSQDWNEALARLQTIYDQDPQAANQQYNQLRMQANEQLTSLLTPQQLANWRRMAGAQFEFPASAFLRPSNQSLDPTGDTAREQVNEQLENQQNDSIFDGNRVPGQGGSEIGTEASPDTSSNLDIGNPQNDSTIPQPGE